MRTRAILSALATAAALGWAGCKHVPTDKERAGAQIHYDLGIQLQQTGDVQGALKEYQTSVDMDPGFPEAHHALALVLHLFAHRLDEAEEHFHRALELRPDFSEAKTNLGNLYLDRNRYDDAIHLYLEALNDMAYTTPYIAQGNLGWALYQKGSVAEAVDHLKTSTTLNTKFCFGYMKLGIIYEAQNDNERACKQFDKYREHCPEEADAYLRNGLCLAKLARPDEAKRMFAACQTKAGQNEQLRDECRQLQEKLQ